MWPPRLVARRPCTARRLAALCAGALLIPAARLSCLALAATSRSALFSDNRHERAPGHLGVETIPALAPPLPGTDRDVDLPGQPDTGSLCCIVDLVPVGIADDEHVNIGWCPAALPGISGRPGAEQESGLDADDLGELLCDDLAWPERAKQQLGQRAGERRVGCSDQPRAAAAPVTTGSQFGSWQQTFDGSGSALSCCGLGRRPVQLRETHFVPGPAVPRNRRNG